MSGLNQNEYFTVRVHVQRVDELLEGNGASRYRFVSERKYSIRDNTQIKEKMNNKCFIHVGMAKTATTFLQKEFFPQLEDVFYLGRPYTQENNAFNTLQYAPYPDFEEKKLLEELGKINSHNTEKLPLLISDELFNGYPMFNFINRETIAKRFSSVFPQAEIIIFLRNQKDLINSLYNQLVKNGWLTSPLNDKFIHSPNEGFSLDQWMSGSRDWDISNRYINHRSTLNICHFRFNEMLEMYNNYFPKVHTLLFEDFLKDKQGCLERLSKIIGSEGPEKGNTIDNEKMVNTRLETGFLSERLVENNLKILRSSNGRLARYAKKILEKETQKKFNNLEKKNEEYLLKVIAKDGTAENNRRANERWNLGMDKFPNEYLQAESR